MEDLKSLFGEGSLSYEEFSQKLGEASDTIKLANLKSGNYVDKAKYEKLEKGYVDYQTKYEALTESTKGYDELKASYEDITNKYTTLLNEQEETKKMGLVNSSNVNPKFAKFVYTEVQSMVDENKDFQTALAEYLKDNKEFLNAKPSTYVDLEKGTSQHKTENQIINEKIRGMRK